MLEKRIEISPRFYIIYYYTGSNAVCHTVRITKEDLIRIAGF
jgi:hypothetical protein